MTLHDMNLTATIDRIYETAQRPETWPGLLDDISRIADARGGVFMSLRPEFNAWTSSAVLRPMVERFFSDGWHVHRSLADRLMGLPAEQFHADYDHVTEEELSSAPLYSDFVRPSGTGPTVSTHVQTPFGDNLVMIIAKDLGTPPVSREQVRTLTQLRPHLGRSATMAARFDIERIRGAIEGYTMTGLAAAAIAFDGTVIETNPMFADMTAYAAMTPLKTMRLTNPAAQKDCEDFLEDIRKAGQLNTLPHKMIAVPATHGAMPAVIHLLPVRRGWRDVFARAALIMVITPLEEPLPPPSELMQGLFELSIAETRVLHLIAACYDVNRIAEELAISRDTVRFHLKNIFHKTGVSRQSDLTYMVASIPTFPQRDS